MTYEEAIDEIKSLRDKLDKNGFMTALIVTGKDDDVRIHMSNSAPTKEMLIIPMLDLLRDARGIILKQLYVQGDK